MKPQTTAVITLLLLAGCSPASVAPVAETIPVDVDNWQLEMKKADADMQAQHRYQRAYIECQEYKFALKGCDVIKRKRDTDERAALMSAEQQRKAEKAAAEKIVSDEAAELSR